MIVNYDVLCVSPHLDDAVLSCGGHIHRWIREGRRVLVATVAAGDPPGTALPPLAQLAHKLWSLPATAMRHRRVEDREACAMLGAQCMHLNFAESVYRRDPRTGDPLYAVQDDIYGPVHEHDLEVLLPQLSVKLAELPSHATVYAPLGVGGHVDHSLTRNACEQAFDSNVVWYEEFPYCRVEDARCSSAIGLGWEEVVTQLTQEDIDCKVNALGCYRSQISALAGTLAELERVVRQYACEVGGERGWITRA